MNLVKKLFKEEKGQGMTEYALVLGIIAAAFAVIFALGLDDLIAAKFTTIAGNLNQ